MFADQIVWTPDMSVGCDTLDADHKILVALLNEFVEACENDEGILVTDSIFSGLIDYTHYHFSREERILAACGYPDLEAHHLEHAKMAQKVVDCREAFMLSVNKMLEADVRAFLLSWLQEHILGNDMEYKDIIAAHPDEVARVLAEEAAEP